jgi:hypothetical protein
MRCHSNSGDDSADVFITVIPFFVDVLNVGRGREHIRDATRQ